MLLRVLQGFEVLLNNMPVLARSVDSVRWFNFDGELNSSYTQISGARYEASLSDFVICWEFLAIFYFEGTEKKTNMNIYSSWWCFLQGRTHLVICLLWREVSVMHWLELQNFEIKKMQNLGENDVLWKIEKKNWKLKYLCEQFCITQMLFHRPKSMFSI